jgi:hypothetical protein
MSKKVGSLGAIVQGRKFLRYVIKRNSSPRATRAYQLYLEKYQNMAQAYPRVLVS